MLISQLFTRHKVPEARFLPGLFLGLLLFFVILGQSKPVVGLVGLGTVLLVAGALVEFNRTRIWENYKKTYKKNKKLAGFWNQPSDVYYMINVVLLWPFIMFIGFVCLWASYVLA
jgi:hypothetical protein